VHVTILARAFFALAAVAAAQAPADFAGDWSGKLAALSPTSAAARRGTLGASTIHSGLRS